jgi:hypothetical protein
MAANMDSAVQPTMTGIWPSAWSTAEEITDSRSAPLIRCV